ncbi:putative integral membrane protein [[Actinomadura] parvosata subsp. kistnae]|uniref:DoxX family protein n=1 Tax=[Actinomadura] parvosata TaxID=1955412 RepID=UPI000D2CF538|nr:putative integral membrane protein [Actinomadura parvosata subsp. kistnae]
MNVALWIIAGLLAAAFLAGGTIKLVLPKKKLAATSTGGWAEDFGTGSVKTIGVLEVLAAAGLILPAALGIAPVLVPLAALGLALLMVGAMITHLRRHEEKAIVVNVAYLVLAVFVAWCRFGPIPFAG